MKYNEHLNNETTHTSVNKDERHALKLFMPRFLTADAFTPDIVPQCLIDQFDNRIFIPNHSNYIPNSLHLFGSIQKRHCLHVVKDLEYRNSVIIMCKAKFKREKVLLGMKDLIIF